jgi:hypothetical protein
VVYGQEGGLDVKIPLKRGDEVKLGTVISTSKRSFARIRFEDDSIVTIAPKSKILLTQKNKNTPKILTLVAGKIRAEVIRQANQGQRYKLYVKTRSATLGVRGTEFVVSYNDKNHNTSNITLDGEVHIYKNSDKGILESLRQLDDSDREELGDYNEALDLRDQLTSHEVERVTKGTFSSAKFNHEKAHEPIRISAVQINALKGSNFVTGKKEKTKEKDSKFLKGNQYQRQTIEGNRHGGFVDLASGLYIAPPVDAKFDDKKGTYEMPKELGGVNLTTGEYSPPKGIVVDPITGFTAHPLYYEDRDVLQNLKKLTTLAGPIDKQLQQAVRIFKHIARTDFYGFGDFKQPIALGFTYVFW